MTCFEMLHGSVWWKTEFQDESLRRQTTVKEPHGCCQMSHHMWKASQLWHLWHQDPVAGKPDRPSWRSDAYWWVVAPVDPCVTRPKKAVLWKQWLDKLDNSFPLPPIVLPCLSDSAAAISSIQAQLSCQSWRFTHSPHRSDWVTLGVDDTLGDTLFQGRSRYLFTGLSSWSTGQLWQTAQCPGTGCQRLAGENRRKLVTLTGVAIVLVLLQSCLKSPDYSKSSILIPLVVIQVRTATC